MRKTVTIIASFSRMCFYKGTSGLCNHLQSRAEAASWRTYPKWLCIWQPAQGTQLQKGTSWEAASPFLSQTSMAIDIHSKMYKPLQRFSSTVDLRKTSWRPVFFSFHQCHRYKCTTSPLQTIIILEGHQKASSALLWWQRVWWSSDPAVFPRKWSWWCQWLIRFC